MDIVASDTPAPAAVVAPAGSPLDPSIAYRTVLHSCQVRFMPNAYAAFSGTYTCNMCDESGKEGEWVVHCPLCQFDLHEACFLRAQQEPVKCLDMLIFQQSG